MGKWKLRIIAVAVTIVVVMIIIAVVGMDRNGIVNQYYALSNRPENSAGQFKIPFGYITINSDGTINIEFATSIPTISNDIDVADGSYEGADPDDDTQNPSQGNTGGNGSGGGNGGGSSSGGSGSGGGGVAPPPNPITGNFMEFPGMGESLWYKEINNKSNSGYLNRVGPDLVTWEFALGYISTTNNPDYKTMKKRANKILPYVTNANTNDALKVDLGGEQYYVGCLPIAGFGRLGDIVQFNFSDGSSIKVLGIDAKSADDAENKGYANQVNTQYCHGSLANGGVRLSAIELWCAGNKTSSGNTNTWPTGTVVSAEIVGHSNVFN